MIATFAATVLAVTAAAAPDTVRPPLPRAVVESAYLDPRSRELVEGARDRRTTVEGSIQRYQNLARSRVSVGMTTLRRERLFYRCESAVRVDWQYGQPTRVEVLGARSVFPMVNHRVKAEDGDCSGAVFDPAEDRLSFASAGLMRTDTGLVRHPLAAGSEVDYRFRAGDVTTMRLADGRVIRLHELQVIPRRSEPRLVSGSLWLEEESNATVRAVLRLARPFDIAAEDDEVPGIMRPLYADVRFMTVEYALWEGRWWLPRLIAYEGEAQAGGLLKLPLRVEQTYEDYRVWGAEEVLPTPAERLAGAPRECRQRRRGGEPVDSATREPRSLTIVMNESGVVMEADFRAGCTCSGQRCFEIEHVFPRDSAQRITSPHLPSSIFTEGDALMSEHEMSELLRQVNRAAPAPWQLVRPRIRWGWQGFDLLRYNRVEGLSSGLRADVDLGPAAADATVRIGFADLVPNAELGITTRRATTARRLALYHRLATVQPVNRALGPGNSLAALLLGRDDGDYYRSAGAELLLAPATGSDGLRLRLYGEHQRAAKMGTAASLPRLWGGGGFRENIEAEELAQAGSTLSWHLTRGLNPAGARGSLNLAADGAYLFMRDRDASSVGILQPTATATASAPLFGRLLGAVELAGGTTAGEAPIQRLWHLGGPATVRGYGGAAAVGDTFWRGRVEVGNALPAFRLIGFSDAGWAGIRREAQLDPTLLSAGVGLSFLDGLLRADLARALRGSRSWRLDLHVDAAL